MITFDQEWYLREYPEVSREMETGRWASAEAHYHQRGSRQGCSPSPSFDEQWYRAAYPDVAERIAAGVFRSGLHHYLLYGARERRSPNGAFDEIWYLQANPDVASAVARGDLRCGFEHFLLSGDFEGRASGSSHLFKPRPSSSYQPVVTENLLPFALHVWLNPAKRKHPHLNLVLPSLHTQHMSGGPNTALLLVIELSKIGVPIRLLASNDGVDPDIARLRAHIESLSGDPLSNIEIADASNPGQPAVIGAHDIFLATAWWTAQMIAAVLPRMHRRTFFYLIQDFEPGFHPWSSDYSLAFETYDMDIIPIINTALLRDHLVDNQGRQFRDPSFRSRIHTFEPAIDRRHFYYRPESAGRKHRLLFYARPQIAKRNLFEIGLSALIKAAARGVFPPGQWNLHFIGENLPETAIGHGVVIRPIPWLDFASYARLMRTSDILLSLMMSPHPSYAPLEMAACGGVVVTNSFACKTQERLAGYSPQILAPPPFAQPITEALEHAAGIVSSGGYGSAALMLPSTWQESFAPILPGLRAAWEQLQ